MMDACVVRWSNVVDDRIGYLGLGTMIPWRSSNQDVYVVTQEIGREWL